MSRPAIIVDDIGKAYRIGLKEETYPTFREAMVHAFKAPVRRFRSLGERGTEDDTFWALRHINFEVQPGEVVGIIGRNGAGKSTLLKVLSRITEPTEGLVRLRGRVASLLEVGTGFHPELTGRENVYLNGSILGMKRAEIDRKFDEIVAFAGVEQFLDTPVKRYSSGMYVRLAFAVAANLEPEILIVDEVLAVGDAEFQKKCLGKMREVSQGGGRTVLFVSHNMSAVMQLCQRGILLQKGRLAMVGAVGEVIQVYSSSGILYNGSKVVLTAHPNRIPSLQGAFRWIEFLNENGNQITAVRPSQEIRIRMVLALDRPIGMPRIGIGFNNQKGERAFSVATYLSSDDLPHLHGEQLIEVQFQMPPVIPGTYSIDLSAQAFDYTPVDDIPLAASIDVVDDGYLGMTHASYEWWHGYIMVRSHWNNILC